MTCSATEEAAPAAGDTSAEVKGAASDQPDQIRTLFLSQRPTGYTSEELPAGRRFPMPRSDTDNPVTSSLPA